MSRICVSAGGVGVSAGGVGGYPGFDSLKKAVGAKQLHGTQAFDIDCIFTFTVNSGNAKTTVDHMIALIDTTLLQTFAPLKDPDGKLKGRLEFDLICYSIEC